VGLAAVVATALYFLRSHRLRHQDVNPKAAMLRGAAAIAELLATRYVVMGHTHDPVLAPVGENATYVNLGHWGVDDLDGRRVEASRTHFVIRFIDGEHRAELLRWVPDLGPVRPPQLG
jgi:UDP-2,3-diacylglucosamine pyrophosphatase LpxH